MHFPTPPASILGYGVGLVAITTSPTSRVGVLDIIHRREYSPTRREGRMKVKVTKVKVTITLDALRWRELRVKALREGTSASVIIDKLVAKYLKGRREKP